MRTIHLTIVEPDGDTFHPAALYCYKRKCDGCDLRFYCFTTKKFVPYTVSIEEDYARITLDWALNNLEFHNNGYSLVWNTSKAKCKAGEFRKTYGN